MKKYNGIKLKLNSNIFFKTIFCMVLLIFGALMIKFGNWMFSLASNYNVIDGSNSNSQIVSYDINEENDAETPLYVDLSANQSEYVTASLESEIDYPENWISDFNSKIVELQKLFPSGKYWNHMGKETSNPEETNNIYSVTDIPCNHSKYGEAYCNAHYGKSNELYPYYATCSQCRGFASLLSDLVFGEDAPVRYFENYDELRIGDQARIDGDYHSVFIIDKTDDYVIVAECNSDLETCKICWGRKILREDMDGWYISRWSDGEE